MASKGMGRHRKGFLEKDGVLLLVQKVDASETTLLSSCEC